MENIRPIV